MKRHDPTFKREKKLFSEMNPHLSKIPSFKRADSQIHALTWKVKKSKIFQNRFYACNRYVFAVYCNRLVFAMYCNRVCIRYVLNASVHKLRLASKTIAIKNCHQKLNFPKCYLSTRYIKWIKFRKCIKKSNKLTN